MDTKIIDNAEADRYELYAGDTRAGLVEYRRLADEITLLHTEIDPDFEGQGLGSVLARHVLDDARDRGLAVLPRCPFLNGWIARHPDYAELVPADQRDRFGL